jgi:hypothetical protein
MEVPTAPSPKELVLLLGDPKVAQTLPQFTLPGKLFYTTGYYIP